jgi:hypothetical protein
MINALGSLSLIWLILWVLLTLLMSLVYPLIRPLIMRLHPAHGASTVLLFRAAPLLVAFLASLMLFAPMPEDLLIAPHCHGSCIQHAPQTSELSVAVLGLVLAVVVTAILVGNFLHSAWRGWRMRQQFELLSSAQNGYQLLNVAEPIVFTLGWWNPRVFLSNGLLKQCSPEQLSVILDHEQACDFESANAHTGITVAETLVHVGRLLKDTSRPQSSLALNGGDLPIRVHALLSMEQRMNLRSWQLIMIVVVLAAVLLLTLDPLHHGAEMLIGWLETIGVY